MNLVFSRLLCLTVLALSLAVVAPSTTLAASPSGSAVPAGGDPRSPGEGAGLVGDPLFAIATVLVIGVASLVVTYLYVRLTAAKSQP